MFFSGKEFVPQKRMRTLNHGRLRKTMPFSRHGTDLVDHFRSIKRSADNILLFPSAAVEIISSTSKKINPVKNFITEIVFSKILHKFTLPKITALERKLTSTTNFIWTYFV